MKLDLLNTAIATLQCETAILVELWQPLPSRPPLNNGTWGRPEVLPAPFSVSIPQDTTVLVSPAGQEYVLAVKIYCDAGEAVAKLFPSERRARITYNGVKYRVMEFRTWDPTSNHAEVLCRLDKGDAPQGSVSPVP